mmetsp:Transcript_44454/g.144299  ORF Transcript_44454/g.144299 Transcript_44454/m.144299 type:complete len:217 (-) Transcript_44454:113-763(-)
MEGRGVNLDVDPRAAAPDQCSARHRRHRLHRGRPEGARRARRRQGALRHRGRRAGRHPGAAQQGHRRPHPRQRLPLPQEDQPRARADPPRARPADARRDARRDGHRGGADLDLQLPLLRCRRRGAVVAAAGRRARRPLRPPSRRGGPRLPPPPAQAQVGGLEAGRRARARRLSFLHRPREEGRAWPLVPSLPPPRPVQALPEGSRLGAAGAQALRT